MDAGVDVSAGVVVGAGAGVGVGVNVGVIGARTHNHCNSFAAVVTLPHSHSHTSTLSLSLSHTNTRATDSEETDRNSFAAVVTAQDMEDTYLPAFQVWGVGWARLHAVNEEGLRANEVGKCTGCVNARAR